MELAHQIRQKERPRRRHRPQPDRTGQTASNLGNFPHRAVHHAKDPFHPRIEQASRLRQANTPAATLKKLNAALEALPEEQWDGVRVVTSGVITDNPGLLQVFDDYKVCVVADDVAHESRALKVDIDLSIDDPMMALADQFARMDEDPLLYDPDLIKRPAYVVKLAKDNKADGCLLFMMNFDDTEEMEYPSLKQAFSEAKIPLVKVGYDQQMSDFGQVKTQLETFNEIVQLNRM